MKQKRGKYIVFEGIDGSGKSTQLVRLAARLEREGVTCVTTREPTEGPIGRVLRQILTGAVKTDERVTAPLFAADRMDHLLNPDHGLCGTLAQGVSALADRYYFSSYAYQTATGLSLERVAVYNADCAALLRADATVFLDLDPAAAMARIAAGRSATELFETRERLTAVRENYFEAFRRFGEGENLLIFNADQSPETLEAEIWEQLRSFFQPDTPR